jgi:hypothetical protein
VAAEATVNVTVVPPVGRSGELVGGVRNIFDAQYADPASSQHRQDTIRPQNGRTARIGLCWKLWTKGASLEMFVGSDESGPTRPDERPDNSLRPRQKRRVSAPVLVVRGFDGHLVR